MNAQDHFRASETLLARAEDYASDYLDNKGGSDLLALGTLLASAARTHAELAKTADQHHRPEFTRNGGWSHARCAEDECPICEKAIEEAEYERLYGDGK